MGTGEGGGEEGVVRCNKTIAPLKLPRCVQQNTAAKNELESTNDFVQLVAC
jgi:hypothetical protein